MEENQIPNAPRKLRKIKRPRPLDNQPVSFGTPSKVNFNETSPNQEQHSDEILDENYFANNGDAENIRFITEEEEQVQYYNNSESIADLLKNKTIILMLVLASLFGLVIGTTFFSGEQTTSKKGLDGVVFNSDVPAGRSRCGLVEPHQGCVLYIMNPKNQEVMGRDFYTTAAQWTQRERYLIETGNMHYSSTRIKPGFIAQINIPPLSNR